MDAEERFGVLVDVFGGRPGVGLPGFGGRRGFGAGALKVDGSIFAMVVGGRLVLKLPRQRVAALIAAGGGEAFQNGSGRVMKEWVVVVRGDDTALAEEAFRFVGRR